jgi:putative component of membrane protein insertase Oxa1/YidC/SpoIIIJ protein YidD
LAAIMAACLTSPLYPHTHVKYLVIVLIVFYQKFISPYKGFRCAYVVLHGGDSCSEAVRKIVQAQGPFGGYRDIRARFQACKEANETLIRNGQRRRGQNDCDECSDCDCDCSDACRSGKWNACEGISCDLPELPCDCAF